LPVDLFFNKIPSIISEFPVSERITWFIIAIRSDTTLAFRSSKPNNCWNNCNPSGTTQIASQNWIKNSCFSCTSLHKSSIVLSKVCVKVRFLLIESLYKVCIYKYRKIVYNFHNKISNLKFEYLQKIQMLKNISDI
jgi:hypothetical protein